jgi:thiamine pyrophosphokinase
MNEPVTRQQTKPAKQDRRRERREEQRRREEKRLQAAKRRRWLFGISAVAIVLAIGAGVYLSIVNRPGPYAGASPIHPRIDNVICDTGGERYDHHVHAHLTIYINGQQATIPQNIGIPTDNSCLYWLHTHDPKGILHVETPLQDTFTLGTFLRIWGEEYTQLQYPLQLEDTGDWKVYVNGEEYKGDFHKIELKAHTLITMAYQSPDIKPDTVYNWGNL